MYVIDNLYGTALSGISENFLFLKTYKVNHTEIQATPGKLFHLTRERFLCAIIISFFILASVERTRLSGYC